MSPKQKKQVILIVVLFTAIIGVGVYQFKSMNEHSDESDGPAKVTIKPKEPIEAPKDNTTNQNIEVYEKLPSRDPFDPQIWARNKQEQPAQKEPAKPVEQPKKQVVKPITPTGPISALPDVTSDPKPLEPQITSRLIGTLDGATPIAIFADVSGEQFLARVNDTVDNSFRVVAISRRGVVLARGAKKYTLVLGGNADANTNY